MKEAISALVCGVIFGIGLAVSEMMDPQRVIGFLDITGQWDPTLLLVMGGALAVTLPGFARVRKRERPVFSLKFQLPTRRDIDTPLILGAVLFGVGWGVAGFCPGPAIAAIATFDPSVLLFVGAMCLGQLVIVLWERNRAV